MTYCTIKRKLEGGWEAETDMDTSVCGRCKRELSGEFYYCEQNKKIYCYNCAKDHSTVYSHQDWHIIKVKTSIKQHLIWFLLIIFPKVILEWIKTLYK